RPVLTLKDHIYCIRATAEGSGRNGHVFAGGDAPLDLNMSVPKAMGGKGDGPNPEQLFAMGYASCFLGALQLAASRAGKKELADAARVHAAVRLGHPTDREGLALNVNIDVEGVDDDAVIASAHEICPYSRALSLGAQVTVLK
ncbi:OsmC-domain-containing protein, partial [Dentipellis sp. KUC8613]